MKRKYEPPQARNIFATSAKGQVTEGVCKSGSYPYYDCASGPAFFLDCATGATVDTSACDKGGYHLEPACNQGNSAATVCMSGSTQQF